MGKNMKKLQNKIFLLFVVTIGMLLGIVGLFYSSFALVEPVKSISFTSQNLNYNEKEPGSFKIEKSVEWTSKGKAKITINLDTIERREKHYTDMIFVLDTSGSMAGEKLRQAKLDIKELFNGLLETEGNRGALITFDQDSTILSDFTDDINLLDKLVDSLYEKYTTNYYQALVSVGELLENYEREENREVVVVFMTDGVPNSDIPNEKNYFKYLKEAYPYITVNAVQYEMGNEVLDIVKAISDNQYIAHITTLKEALLKASIVTVPYSKFRVTDLINSTYFSLENEGNIKITYGKAIVDSNTQKVTWNLDGLKSGSSATMTIDIMLKEEYMNEGGIYSTNESIKVDSQILQDIENIEINRTPTLKNEFQVSYDVNLPKGCVVENIPGSKNYFTFDPVEVEDEIFCEGYQFRGWKVATKNVNRPSEDYFIMPESDVVLRGEWTNLSMTKSMNGDVYLYIEPVLQRIGTDNYNKELWKYKDSITKVIIQNEIKDIKEATETFDISEGNNYGVVGYIVPNTDEVSATTYTAYIQGDGNINGNQDSSYLFYGFKQLETIEGLEYLDTSSVTNMSNMFRLCSKIKRLDVSSFDTSKVTNMERMFQGDYYGDSSLEYLDVSSFNTSKVTNMFGMFYGLKKITSLKLSNFNTSNVTTMSQMFLACNSLTSLDLSGFNTSKVTNMDDMFNLCYALTELNISHFDTSEVTTMSHMFSGCNSLTSLDVSNFDTSNVTNMRSMFRCGSLTSLDVSNFDTSKVTNMSSMFGCDSLTSLDISNFNTSNVENMQNMFYACSSLTSLDLSSFDTTKVTNMSGMFMECNNLTSLDLSSFSISNVENMQNMFYACSSLTSLDLSSFDTSNVTTMVNMFYFCKKITSLDLSGFDTTKVTNMSNMFNSCNSLISLDLSNFDTSNVTNMSGMFNSCNSLINLDLSNFDTSKVIYTDYMFYNCWNLSTTIVIKGTVINNYSNMFSGSATGVGSGITVNYTNDTSDLVDLMIATKSTNSNVVKGILV